MFSSFGLTLQIVIRGQHLQFTGRSDPTRFIVIPSQVFDSPQLRRKVMMVTDVSSYDAYQRLDLVGDPSLTNGAALQAPMSVRHL